MAVCIRSGFARSVERMIDRILEHVDVPRSDDRRGPSTTARTAKRERHRAMRELVARHPIGSQQEFVELLSNRGLRVTQATVSRDIAELGLVKTVRADRHVYASPEDLAPSGAHDDVTLRRLLRDLPVTIRRSGLTLLLISTPGMANALAQAIDDSSSQEQEGTLAGDNTVLVLFADGDRLDRWRSRIERMLGRRSGGDR
jgi:transcriptional regulator of arginine metabolism